jgi:hypothetical protein
VQFRRTAQCLDEETAVPKLRLGERGTVRALQQGPSDARGDGKIKFCDRIRDDLTKAAPILVFYDILGLLDCVASLFDSLLSSVRSGFSGFLSSGNGRIGRFLCS